MRDTEEVANSMISNEHGDFLYYTGSVFCECVYAYICMWRPEVFSFLPFFFFGDNLSLSHKFYYSCWFSSAKDLPVSRHPHESVAYTRLKL